MSLIIGLLDTLFDDKRAAIVTLVMFLVLVATSFSVIGFFSSDFVRFGPHPTAKIMSVSIVTWRDWSIVAVATFVTTLFNDFFVDALAPWFQNTIQDHKTKYLPYSKFTCYMILQAWSVYGLLMSAFSISIMTCQIDFLLIRLVADLLVNTFTAYKFMRGKVVDPKMYVAEGGQAASGEATKKGEESQGTEMTTIITAADEEEEDDELGELVAACDGVKKKKAGGDGKRR